MRGVSTGAAQQAHALRDMHVDDETVEIYHISEEDDRARVLVLRDPPRLTQIHVDEDPGHDSTLMSELCSGYDQ